MQVGTKVYIEAGDRDAGIDEVIEAVVIAERQVPTFTAAGELAGMRREYFAQTGACSAGKIGAWIDSNGKFITGEPEVL